MVVLLVLGLIGGMGVLAVSRLRPVAAPERVTAWRRARATAIRTGQPIGVADDSGVVVRFLPDGRAIGSDVDPLTGEALRAAE